MTFAILAIRTAQDAKRTTLRSNLEQTAQNEPSETIAEVSIMPNDNLVDSTDARLLSP